MKKSNLALQRTASPLAELGCWAAENDSRTFIVSGTPMANAAFSDAIFKFVVKSFWPWFIKNIWPVIVRYVVSLIGKGLRNLSEGIGKSVSDRMQKRREDAEAQAKSASNAAASAGTQVERERHEAIAAVWRQVADQFRAENETLKRQVAELTARTQQSLQEDMQLAHPLLEDISLNPTISIGGNTSQLPALTYEEPAA